MQITLNVTGMTCGHCEKAVKQAVLDLDPKATVIVDRQNNVVQVESILPKEAIANVITQEGYVVQAV